MKARSSRRVSGGRKGTRVPLANLRAAEVVRTIMAHPRRLEELVSMIEDGDRRIRDRAAATLARLAESHPERLLRVLERLQNDLADESAYVRWNLVFSLGAVGARYPRCVPELLAELARRLSDDNRVVRVMACRALVRIARRAPQPVAQHFETSKLPAPRSLQSVLRAAR